MKETKTGIVANSLEAVGGYLIATTETITGTQKYKVYMNGEKPVTELLDSQIYSDSLITIKPVI